MKNKLLCLIFFICMRIESKIFIQFELIFANGIKIDSFNQENLDKFFHKDLNNNQIIIDDDCYILGNLTTAGVIQSFHGLKITDGGCTITGNVNLNPYNSNVIKIGNVTNGGNIFLSTGNSSTISLKSNNIVAESSNLNVPSSSGIGFPLLIDNSGIVRTIIDDTYDVHIKCNNLKLDSPNLNLPSSGLVQLAIDVNGIVTTWSQDPFPPSENIVLNCVSLIIQSPNVTIPSPGYTLPLTIDSTGTVRTLYSTRKMKKNINELSIPCNYVKYLKPYSFEYTEESGLSGGMEWGFIAEDLLKTPLETIIIRNKEGTILNVNDRKIIAFLSGIINQLVEKIDKLEFKMTEIDQMKKKLDQVEKLMLRYAK